MYIIKKISKKTVLRLALFAAVIISANLIDIYINDKKIEIKEINQNPADDEKSNETVLLFNQSCSSGIKISVNKPATRKIQLKLHDKLVQKYYQLRNYQVLKAEVQTLTTPLITAYHYLAFKNYFYSIPDDDQFYS